MEQFSFLQIKQRQFRRQQLLSTGERFNTSISMVFGSWVGREVWGQWMKLEHVFCGVGP